MPNIIQLNEWWMMRDIYIRYISDNHACQPCASFCLFDRSGAQKSQNLRGSHIKNWPPEMASMVRYKERRWHRKVPFQLVGVNVPRLSQIYRMKFLPLSSDSQQIYPDPSATVQNTGIFRLQEITNHFPNEGTVHLINPVCSPKQTGLWNWKQDTEPRWGRG